MQLRTTGLAALVLSPFCLTELASSQTQTIVSPNAAATVEGNGMNMAPWCDSRQRRYMQIHSDLGNTPKLIQKLAWRKNGAAGLSPAANFDMELYVGDSVDWNQARFVIKNNYLRTPTLAVARKVVSLGPTLSTGSPSPFDVVLALDQPYYHSGVSSLAWEAVIYSNSALSGPMDADTGSTTAVTVSASGSGCTVSGQVNPMSIVISASDVGGGFGFGGYLQYGPPNAASVLFLGTTNPNQTLPFLCGALYTDLVLGLSIGATDSNGFIGTTNGGGTSKVPGGAFQFSYPNTFAGASVKLQAHVLDAASTYPVQVANSNGAALTVPFPNLTQVNRASRVYHNDNGPTEQNAIYFPTSALGYVLVTQFTY